VIEAEKQEARWTYKKEKGYQPLLGFLFELGLALGDEFRDGNVPVKVSPLSGENSLPTVDVHIDSVSIVEK